MFLIYVVFFLQWQIVWIKYHKTGKMLLVYNNVTQIFKGAEDF